MVLDQRRHDWLNQRGHLGLPESAANTIDTLRRIFLALGGDESLLAQARTTALPNDYFHEPTSTLVEVDEFQHFTSHRLITLSMYPDNVVLGFDREQYIGLCTQTSARADRYRATKDAKCFGEGGRQRQRAYHDALRDLAAPALGHTGVIRAPALDQDGAAAWRAVWHRLPAPRH
ncbi:MAG: hypothetical protein Q8R60_06720 [Mycobacteriales bacterium]|nr:hypothetical protein [Mycobacteriales bacterium]